MMHLFKSVKEEIYDSLFFTHCCYCGKRIIVDIPEKYKRFRKHDCFSCNNCIRENSAARDDVNESTYTDVSNKLWGEIN